MGHFEVYPTGIEPASPRLACSATLGRPDRDGRIAMVPNPKGVAALAVSTMADVKAATSSRLGMPDQSSVAARSPRVGEYANPG